MNIINVGYSSTNYWLIGPDRARLLIDVGWPGTLFKLLHECKRKDVELHDIQHLLITHYHPDHAGLAEELKQRGIKLIVLDTQLGAIPELGRYIKPDFHYQEITLVGAIQLTAASSREFLRRNGIAGEIILTPGHSDDSITLVLDSGEAFTGDLPPPMFATEESQPQIEKSWANIRAHGARMIYPAHGPVRPLT